MKDQRETLKLLEELDRRKTYMRMAYFEPYPKQLEFIALGRDKRERLLMAANQVGKSYVGAFETACHLTGRYPSWWPGRKWDRPTKGWAACETSLLTRDVAQKLLMGEPGVLDAIGSGMIPKEDIVDTSLARGVTDAYDTIQVKHYTNGVYDGISVLRFKSYEQGRSRFQGDTLDFIWDDEEPPIDVYSEEVTRTNATGGMIFTTFTPLQGMSDVVIAFLQNPTPERGLVTMTIDDALHISAVDRAKIIASYMPHELEARTKGVPMMGSGRIFVYAEDSITEPAIGDVPLHWFKLWGTDFGIGNDHPFAAVLILWDKDADVIHVHHEVRMSNELPDRHAKSMKPIGAAVPVAWPHDGINREKLSGDQVASGYKKEGLLMLPHHATFADGGYSTEAGVLEMDMRFSTGRLKISKACTMLLDEYRIYHRKDGMIVKTRDDLLSALRIAIMDKRFARAVPLGSGLRRRKVIEAIGIDFPLF